jgi:hypothetical protein
VDKGHRERIEILSEAIYEVFEPIEAIAMTVQEWEGGESMIVDFAREGEIVYSAHRASLLFFQDPLSVRSCI